MCRCCARPAAEVLTGDRGGKRLGLPLALERHGGRRTGRGEAGAVDTAAAGSGA
ncbi:hypothetical protein [Streptomyces sp. Ag109_O5-10]|uniref:hypothetical protein n=1 Tax=Streptomyces sp. Ag109_O5-10 TaxID=1855349 RepID=UPI00089A525B|nr:hypothetical protein [Streptomyces sp. Ag109_O5-10]SEE53947.1 hypothetical protein SAMN05216533_2648 [Streptomyces sp. Ag109_O5-10]